MGAARRRVRRSGVLQSDDVVRLSPPGFGAPVPQGWGATVEEYRLWLVGELEALGEPVDLVGHDWGGGHVANVAMTRPDLLRSWCSDILGVFEPDYVWHDMAQVWQTPGRARRPRRRWSPTRDESGGPRRPRGDPDVAEEMAKSWTDDIPLRPRALPGRRAARHGAARRAPARRGRPPGLAIQATDDHFVGTDDMRRRAAERAGARVEVLDRLGHWWMLQDPARGAAVLTEFWASLR